MQQCTLNDGLLVPAIGFGPGMFVYTPPNFFSPKSVTLPVRAWSRFVARPRAERHFVRQIASALTNGFRLIDYSSAYGSGVHIGDAIRMSGVKRDDLFITARVSNGAQREGRVREEFFATLRNYGIASVDLLMFHWPVTDYYMDTWREILKLRDEGFAKSVGVANCHIHHIEKLLVGGVVPAVNQIEVHPLFTQKPLIGYCKDKGILVEAYTPIARFDDRLMRLPKLKAIAQKHGKTPVQVVLRWHIQNGIVPVVRSLNTGRQKENIDIFDFELTDDEMNTIDSFNINSRLRYDPDNCDFSML